MATAKKPAAKKAPVKKTPAKSSAVKATASKTAVKSTPKRTTAKKVATKTTAAKKNNKKAAVGYKSFQVSQGATPFNTFRVTRQTVYWVILVAFIIFVQLWILNLHVEVATLLEQQQTQLQDEI